MAAMPAQMSADELLELTDDGRVHELRRGILLCMSPTAYGPGRVGGRIMGQLFPFIDAHGLGEYGSAETGFRLMEQPDTVRAPDVWFVRAARVPPVDADDGYFRGVPDLAIEVLSPSDRFGDVIAKVRDYLDAGTPLVWVFDPKARMAAVFRPGQPVRFIDGDGALDGEDVLPGFSLQMREIFR